MAKAKWIGSVLGWLSGGPLGALAGFVLGVMFDVVNTDGLPEGQPSSSDQNGYNSPYQSAEQRQAARNGFLFSLLTLASYIIKADNRIMHSEMEAMRRFLLRNFGQAAVEQGEQIMLRLFERQKQMDQEQPGAYQQTIFECCQQLTGLLTDSQRLELLSLLVMLAKADGQVAPEEIQALRNIALHLQLSEAELNSMLNLGSTTLHDAYRVLEIDETATDDEVRRAYKRMAVKHHPDRVAALGEDIQKAAEEKMRKINEAKDLIYKSRGL